MNCAAPLRSNSRTQVQARAAAIAWHRRRPPDVPVPGRLEAHISVAWSSLKFRSFPQRAATEVCKSWLGRSERPNGHHETRHGINGDRARELEACVRAPLLAAPADRDCRDMRRHAAIQHDCGSLVGSIDP